MRRSRHKAVRLHRAIEFQSKPPFSPSKMTTPVSAPALNASLFSNGIDAKKTEEHWIRIGRSALLIVLLGLAGFFSPRRAEAAGTWTAINHAPPHGLDNPLLLSDGTVMCGDGGSGWYKYTPDSSGNYANGTWTTLAS